MKTGSNLKRARQRLASKKNEESPDQHWEFVLKPLLLNTNISASQYLSCLREGIEACEHIKSTTFLDVLELLKEKEAYETLGLLCSTTKPIDAARLLKAALCPLNGSDRVISERQAYRRGADGKNHFDGDLDGEQCDEKVINQTSELLKMIDVQYQLRKLRTMVSESTSVAGEMFRLAKQFLHLPVTSRRMSCILVDMTFVLDGSEEITLVNNFSLSDELANQQINAEAHW